MNTLQSSAMDAQVKSVMKLLLNDKPTKPALAFLAGPELDPSGRMAIYQLAADTQIDLVYLAFRIDDADQPVLADIAIYLPRDRGCYGWTECTMVMVPGKHRAVLVSPGYRGYFSLLQDEILQRPKRLKWMPRREEQRASRSHGSSAGSEATALAATI